MKTAMILAAGRGERLKPLTNTIPKALCEIRGKALIVYHVENLAKSGFERIVVNHAYLGGKIRACLGKGEAWGIKIEYSPEPPGGLETGGGLINALPLLGSSPFITVNADIWTDYNLANLKLPSQSLAHLILVPKNLNLNHKGDFGLTEEGNLSLDYLSFTVSGMTAYNPELFKNCEIGRWRLPVLWRKYLPLNKITGEVYQGQWFDIGSIDRLKAAEAMIQIA